MAPCVRVSLIRSFAFGLCRSSATLSARIELISSPANQRPPKCRSARRTMLHPPSLPHLAGRYGVVWKAENNTSSATPNKSSAQGLVPATQACCGILGGLGRMIDPVLSAASSQVLPFRLLLTGIMNSVDSAPVLAVWTCCYVRHCATTAPANPSCQDAPPQTPSSYLDCAFPILYPTLRHEVFTQLSTIPCGGSSSRPLRDRTALGARYHPPTRARSAVRRAPRYKKNWALVLLPFVERADLFPVSCNTKCHHQ